MVAYCPERNPIKVTFLRASDEKVLPTLQPLQGKSVGAFSDSQVVGDIVMVTDGSEAVLILDSGEATAKWFKDSGCTFCPRDGRSQDACRRYGGKTVMRPCKGKVAFNFPAKELKHAQSHAAASRITVGLSTRRVLLYLLRALQALSTGSGPQKPTQQGQQGPFVPKADTKVIDFHGYDMSTLPPELTKWEKGETRMVRYFEDQPPYIVTYVNFRRAGKYLHEMVTPDNRPIALDLEWFPLAKPPFINVYQMCQGQRVLVIQDAANRPWPEMREFLSSHSFYSKGTDCDKKMLQSRFGPEFFVDMEDVAETRLKPHGESIKFTEMATKFGGRATAEFKSKKISRSKWHFSLDTRQVLYAGFDVAALSACYPNFPPKIWDGGDILFNRYHLALFKTSWFFWDFGLTRQVRLSRLTDKPPYSVTLTRADDCSELSSFATGEPIGLAMFRSGVSESQPVDVYAFCQGQRVVVVQDDQPQCSAELKRFLSQESGHEFVSKDARRILSRADVPISFKKANSGNVPGLMSIGNVKMICHGRLQIVQVLKAALAAVRCELLTRESAVEAEDDNDEHGEDEEETKGEENNDESSHGEDQEETEDEENNDEPAEDKDEEERKDEDNKGDVVWL